MRYYRISIMLVALLSLLVSAAGTLHARLTDPQLERAKVIVAYEVNKLSLGNNLQGTRENYKSMEALKAAIGGYTKNLKICDEIAELVDKHKDAQDAQDARGLAERIEEDFDYLEAGDGELGKFLENKRKEKNTFDTLIENIENGLLRGISDESQGDRSTVDEEQSSDLYTTQGAGTDEERAVAKRSAKESESSQAPTSWLPLLVVAGLALLVAGLVFVLLSRQIAALRAELSKLSKAQKENGQQQAQRLEQLGRELKQVAQGQSEQQASMDRLSSSAQSYAQPRQEYSQPSYTSPQPSPAPAPSYVAPQPSTLYVSVPQDGVFGSTSTTYRPGDSIYRIDLEPQSDTGRISLINDEETLYIVRGSKSNFLEPVCTIDNPHVSNYTQIEMLESGRVQYIGGVWKLTQKARVRLV